MAGSIVNYPLRAVVDGAHQSMMEIVHQMTCSTQLYTVCQSSKHIKRRGPGISPASLTRSCRSFQLLFRSENILVYQLGRVPFSSEVGPCCSEVCWFWVWLGPCLRSMLGLAISRDNAEIIPRWLRSSVALKASRRRWKSLFSSLVVQLLPMDGHEWKRPTTTSKPLSRIWRISGNVGRLQNMTILSRRWWSISSTKKSTNLLLTAEIPNNHLGCKKPGR